MKDKIIEVLHKYDYDIHMTIDQAAASIMELVDKEKIEFAEWVGGRYDTTRGGFWVRFADTERIHYTTTELLTILSLSKTAKNE